MNDDTEEQKLGLKLQQKIELVEKEELRSNVAQNLVSQLGKNLNHWCLKLVKSFFLFYYIYIYKYIYIYI